MPDLCDHRDDPAGGPDSALAPFPSFSAAAREVLGDLQARLGMRLWLVTRSVGEHQVVLHAQDAPDGYGIDAGAVLSWGGSLCAVMVAGLGPHVAPRVDDVAAYATAPNRELVPIESYLGVPLVRSDGTLFGTLCAFDPEQQPESLRDAESLVRLQSRLLSTVLHLELDTEELVRRAERAETDAARDALTGIGNRRGWDAVLATEEARSRRYGHPACVVVLDVNHLKRINDTRGHAAGDDVLRSCADVLAASARASDYVARLGGDEFALLVVETDRAGAETELERLRAVLADAGIEAALGLGERLPDGTLTEAWQRADEDMYRDKQSRATTPRAV